MPRIEQIVSQLARVAKEAAPVAMAWHAVIVAALIALAVGWRPSLTVRGISIIPLVISVSCASVLYGNPFNASTFLLLGCLLVAFGLKDRGPTPRSAVQLASGALMLVFGFVYPHFIQAGWSCGWLYAAPVGLIPCPTLAIVVGCSLVGYAPSTGGWAITTSTFGFLYGLVGAVVLGVTVDWILVLGSIALLIADLAQRTTSARNRTAGS